MNIIERTLTLLPTAILLGFGVSFIYLVSIMYVATEHLPHIDAITDHLSSLEQIVKVLGG